MKEKIRTLLTMCLPTLAKEIEIEVVKPIIDFKNDSYPRLAALDAQIPGVGMHYVFWEDWTPWFPFSVEFDGILRPLSYVPYLLASNVGVSTASRLITQTKGGHVQECLVEFSTVQNLRKPKIIGKWVKEYESELGQDLSIRVLDYLSSSWNVGKHNFAIGSPESVIPVAHTLAYYIIARSLGTDILIKCNRLQAVVTATKVAYDQGRFYNRPSLGQPYR